jgi:hypothetical protein
MKSYYILLLAFCIMSIANAQHKNHPIPKLGRETIKNPLHANSPYRKNLIPNNKFKQKSTNAIIWNFDTIVTFDTSNNQYLRITQTFNNYGYVLTNKIELWQNSAWVNGQKYSYTYDANGKNLTITGMCSTPKLNSSIRKTRTEISLSLSTTVSPVARVRVMLMMRTMAGFTDGTCSTILPTSFS